MSGLFTITVEEARGTIAIPADLDQTAIVMGCSSAGSGLSNFFLSGTSAQASVGYGDASDTLCQIIEQENAGAKIPCALYTTPDSGSPGTYGTIDLAGVTGTCVPAVDDSLEPYGTDELDVVVVSGGTVGTTGITYKLSRDAGRHYGNTLALGTATTIAVSNAGSGFVLDPPAAQVTALIAAAVEARADTLAHLADVTAHDAADTSAAQVLLAASSAPTTGAEAIAVLNLAIDALVSHLPNITAHNGPDGTNTPGTTHAVTLADAVARYTTYKAVYNAHLGIALALDTDGLLLATATVAAPVTVTASGMIAGGITLLNAYPRRVTFTTAGVTPADAPATATISGTLFGVAQTPEVVNVGQTATTVSSTKAWDGTGLSIAYSAADGTAATVAIGFGQGVHNSADVTNTLTATTPTQGTLAAGDTFSVRTYAPTPSTSDVTAAFAALAVNAVDFAIVVCEFPCDAAMAAIISAGLNTLRAVGKRVTCLARTRIPDAETGETDAAWNTSVAADFAAFADSRIQMRAAYEFITDAMTNNQYLRSDLAQWAADVVRAPRSAWPDAPADTLSGTRNVTLTNSSGALIGHDEGPMGSSTGLSNPTIGNRFSCVQRLGEASVRDAVYATAPWVLFDVGDTIQTLMARRLANACERVAVNAGIPNLGARLFYVSTGATSGTLTAQSLRAVQSAVFAAVSSEFSTEFDNAQDADLNTGLVQINPAVVVSTGKMLTVAGTVAPNIGGYVLNLEFTLAIQQ
jgi:hypothetical protein